MAKRIILDALEDTLGKYVSNLDPTALNVRLFDGKITLKDLKLDVAAVNAELALLPSPPPFTVVGGSLGEVLVEIPWTKLSSKSVKVKISSLTIIAETASTSSNPSNPTALHLNPNSLVRQSMLTSQNQTRLKTRQLTHSDLWDTEGREESADSFGSRLVQRIIENLDVDVADVNIQIINESGVNKSRTGISLKNFNLHSTDSSGERTFIDRSANSSSFLYKALSVEGLSLHCSDLSNTGAPSYIIKPLTLQLNVKQNDSDDCTVNPKYVVSGSLPSLSVGLSKQQLLRLTDVFRVVEEESFGPLFPENRPAQSVSANPKAWWRYALISIGRISRRRSWREFILAFRRRQKYVKLYKRARYTETEGGTKYKVVTEDYDYESSISNRLSPLSSKELHTLYLIEEDLTVTLTTIMAWRDLAEVEYKIECGKVRAKEGKKKTSFQNFLFGSKKKKEEKETGGYEEGLTSEELQSIQSSLISPTKTKLKDGSTLLSLNFSLNAFKFELFNPDAILRTMILGLTTTINVQSDNSRKLTSTISSISVMDEFTRNNQWPSVVKQLSESSEQGAISFTVDQTSSGDSDVHLSLTGFEITPSISFLNALKDFASLSADPNPTSPTSKMKGKHNPTLEQSLASGDYDLFYDATEPLNQPDETTPTLNFDLDITDNLGAAWSEAWNNKVKSQATWTLDLDLHAPVFILPIDCTNVDSKYLELNLGHFCFKTVKTSDKTVEKFFKEENITGWESFQLELEGLKVQSRQGSTPPNLIVNPTQLLVSVGLERTFSTPLTCLTCVLPLFSVHLNSASAAVIRSLADDWRESISEVNNDINDDVSVNSYSSNNSVMSSKRRKRMEQIDNIGVTQDPKKKRSKTPNKPLLKASFTLQQLTTTLTTVKNTDISANLVSVKSTLISYPNKNNFELKMGYFWIIDNLSPNRQQKLLVHSDLPDSSLSYSANSYKINESLKKLGVYEDAFSSTSLCHITANQNQHSIDVNFKMESIEVHYNPMAVRNILDFVGKMKERHQQQVQLIPPSPTKRPTSFTRSTSRMINTKPGTPTNEASPLPPTNLSFEFKSFVLNMNSANDDLPIFTLKLSKMKVGVLLTSPESISMEASLDDISITTPLNDKISEDYNCIFGLASGVSSSLLEVKYFKNSAEAAKNSILFPSADNIETFCHVSISKIRFVHIQAQILSLTDYIQNGILGVIAAKADDSLDGVISEEASGASLFKIEGSEFEIVVPLEASSLTRSVFNTRKLDVTYNAYENNTGGKAAIELGGFMMRIENSPANGDILDNEVTFNLVVELTGEALDEEIDEMKEMNVQINISSINLAINKSQFDDIMYMVENNITNPDPCLRTDDVNLLDSVLDKSSSGGGNKTHAGIEFQEEEKIIKVMLGMDDLSLKLSSSTKTDFVTLHAKHISINNVLQGNVINAKVKMKSLVVESYGRSFFEREGIDDDILDLEYKKITQNPNGDSDVTLGVKVDRPMITVLPDVLVDLGEFFKKDDRDVVREEIESEVANNVTPSANQSTFKFNVDMADGLVKLINSETEEFLGLRTSVLIQSEGSVDEKETKNANEINISNLEIFKSKSPQNNTTATQILKSVNLILHSTSVVPNNTPNPLERHIFKILCATPLNADLSLRTLKLFLMCSTYLEEGFKAPDGVSEEEIDTLIDLQALEKLETALNLKSNNSTDDEDDRRSVASDSYSNYSIADQGRKTGDIDTVVSTAGRTTKFNITIPAIEVLLIDDLKVLKPIVRVCLDDFSLGFECCEGPALAMYGRGQVHTDVRVDWWSEGKWKELMHPWNITIQASRMHNEKSIGGGTGVNISTETSNVAKMLTSFHLTSSVLKSDITVGFVSRLLEVQERWAFIKKHNPPIFITCHNSLVGSKVRVEKINNDEINREVEGGERVDIEYSNDKGNFDVDYGVLLNRGVNVDDHSWASWEEGGGVVYGKLDGGVVVVRSGVIVRNKSMRKFGIEVEGDGGKEGPNLGTLESGDFVSVPTTVCRGYEGDEIKRSAGLAIILSVGGLKGVIAVPSAPAIEQLDENFEIPVTCTSAAGGGDKVLFKVTVFVERMENGRFLVDVEVKARAKIVNLSPLEMEVKTVMPSTLSVRGAEKDEVGGEVHCLKEGEWVEVFNEGRMIACSFKVGSETLAGSPTDWVKGEWIELQFAGNRNRNSLVGLAGEQGGEVQRFLFPFYEGNGGSSFEIAAGKSDTFEIRPINVIRDHTNEVCFVNEGDDVPMSMFEDGDGGASGTRVCLMPSGEERMRMTRYVNGRPVLSNSFCLNDIALTSSGGLTASSLVVEGTSDVEPYGIYRTLAGNAHVIPHFKLVNETGKYIRVGEPGEGNSSKVELADGTSSVMKPSRRGVFVTLEVDGLGVAGPMTIDRRVGTWVGKIVDQSGVVVGAVRVHTLDGGKFARLIGRVTLMRDAGGGRHGNGGGKDDILDVDVITAKVSMDGVLVTLREGLRRRGKGRGESLGGGVEGEGGLLDGAMDLFGLPAPPREGALRKKKSSVGAADDFNVPVASIKLTGLDVDTKVVFKENKRKTRLVCTANSIDIDGQTGEFPTKIECGRRGMPFLQAAFQWSGYLDDAIVCMDSIIISVGGGKSRLSIRTHENFLWKMLDVFDGIGRDVSGVGVEGGGGVGGEGGDEYGEGRVLAFTAASSEQIYNFKRVQLKPIKLQITFKRKPEKDRWQDAGRAATSPMVAYFLTSLKFQVDDASLNFSGYDTKNVKGGVDTLVTLISAVYINRIKYKWTSLVTAISFDEWKTIAGREGGGDSREEGDILRAVGNVAGSGTGFVLSGLAGGIGGGFAKGVGGVGDGFQKGTEAIGLGELGKGVNSVVSGLGDGVGSTVKGLGDGVGSTVKGVGKGAGQILGGIGGGFHKMGKGLADGIGKGDGDAILKGLGDGAVAIGSGVGGGLETALVGVGDGVMNVGSGLWGGIKSIGRGVQHSVDGKGGTKDKERRKARDEAKKKPTKRTSFFG
ncbi:hypothetical protein TrLO_g14104 [Triparma laevis f. longispina]|uniref:Chorein N-terminal domain-containing protein n=1 Tax=Triparma laevis f. longispina TaxID=1714387 RepID=A0A9W7ALW7_9STRA|nr:hypothetical protein TrLO_g14104 [Triparma laevis f. longispina]